MTRRVFFLLPAIGLAIGPLAMAQVAGSIQGTVRDAQGLVMPGVMVTMTGEAVLGEQSAVTLEDGTYRFRSLRPGTYDLRFELSGFQTLNREGIIMEGGRTITINVTLEVATVAETITVTGESPLVDVKNTALSNQFDSTALQDVPSATDVWAVLAQTPGVRMMGYDVGGSHKSQQSGYESFGIRDQNRVLSDGVDSTEGTGGTGFYYDYYAVEEFTTSAAGTDVEMTTPGSMIVMNIKSGGNRFSGLFHIDYEGEKMVGENIDQEIEDRGGTPAPVRLFWESHVDLGGPIVRDKAWFYGAYNHFKIDKIISGRDPDIATDVGIFDNFTTKLTFQATDKDQIIGYSQWGRKQKPFRGLSLTTPAESILAQDSWSWVHKAEWQRVWSDRAFSNFQLKHFGFIWPMVPSVDPETNPSRRDQATGQNSGAGFLGTNTPPFDFTRWKPQVTATLNYYVPAAAGSHDLKFGFDWQTDSERRGGTAESGTLRYFDNSALGRPNNVDEITFYSVPAQPDNRDDHLDFFAQDTWAISDRVTLNLGARITRQKAHYLETSIDPIEKDFFQAQTVPGETLVIWGPSIAPRLGITYDVTGEGKTVVKGYYGRYYANIADKLRTANPAGVQRVTFNFLDPNTNGLYDGPQELGTVVGDTRGAGGGTPVNPDMKTSYADEISLSVEHEVVADTSVRFSYVRKELKNDFPDNDTWNRGQVLPLLNGQGIPCGDAVFPCPLDPFTGQPLSVLRVPDQFANVQDPVLDTFPGGLSDKYDTIQFAMRRRFSENFFVQGNFDYQWRNERRDPNGESDSPLDADPIYVAFYQNHSATVDIRQENTNWQGKILGRYVFPQEFALSANIRFQSGWPWAPIHRVSIPGSGTQPIFLENIEINRSANVAIIDLRLEKAFTLQDRYKVTGMVDFYNLMNSNMETNFVLRTGGTFRDIIEWVNPRAIKVGARFQF